MKANDSPKKNEKSGYNNQFMPYGVAFVDETSVFRIKHFFK